MSSTTNNYFLNVNTYFRDTDKYPNPCDFGINFSRFNGTGTFVQGAPLNPQNFFQQASIDPDYIDNNLQFVNASINQQERSSTTYIVSGLFDFTKDFKINYLNTTLYSLTGTNYTGPSPTGVYRYVTMAIPYVVSFEIDLNAVIPYIFSWIFYIKPSNVPEIWINLSTKATFQLSQNKNIYFLFDFNMRQFDFVLEKNNKTTLLTSVTNPTIDPKLSNYIGGNYGSICLCLTYIDKSGDVGIVNNHAYGYHLFYGDGDVLGSATNGTFSLTSDFADNAFLSLTFNPSHQKLTNIQETPYSFFEAQTFQGSYVYQQEEEFFFSNSTGPVYCYYSSKAYSASVVSFYTGPFLCMFLQEKSDTPYMDFIKVNPYPFSTSQTSLASNLLFTGAANQVFWWLSSLDSNLSLTNPTGSDIFTVNKTTFAMTPVTRISSTGCASLAFANVGGNIYLFNQNITNWMDVYSYNTSTYVATKITGIQIPTTYFFIRQVFTLVYGTNVYIYSLPSWPGFAPSSYNVQGSQPAFVLLFDTLTNTLSLVSSFTYYNATSFQTESISIRPTKTYLVSGSIGQNKILFYDITNPANVQIVSEIQANNITNHLTWSYTEGGKTRYYLLANISGTPFNKYYDITDIENILELSNSNFYIRENHFELSNSSSQYIGNNKTLSLLDLFYFSPSRDFNIFIGIAELPTKPITLKSVQYNQNLQLTTTLPIVASCCVTFNFNNNAYSVFASNLALQIYNITSIRSTSLVATIPLGLPTIMYDIQFIEYNGLLYFLCSGLGYVLSFILLPTLTSIVPTGLFTAIPDAYSEGRFFINNGILYAVVVSYTSNLYRFAFSPGLTLTNFVNILPPLFPAINALYFDVVTSTFCLAISTTNLTTFADFYFYYNVTTGIILVNSQLGNPGAIPRSGSQVITDPRTGKLYAAAYVNIAVGVNELKSYSTPNVSRNFQTVDLPTHINGKTQLYYTDRPYLVTNVYGGANSNGDYINVYDLTDFEYPIMVFKNNINIVGTGASPLSQKFIVDMKTSIIQDRVTLVCLNSNNTFYLYDISNPEFAGSTQTLQTVTNTQTFSFCPSFGFIYKLDSEGTTQFSLSARSEFTSTGTDGCQINLSNIKIASNNISLYTCGGFTEKIQLFNPNSTSPVNQILNLGGSYDGFVAKCNIITGQWDWIVPLKSFGNDFVQKIQYITSLDSICFAGYTTAGNIVLLSQQNAGSLITPVTPQYNVVGSSNTTNSFVFLLDNRGNYKWSTSIYTNDSLREVTLIDIGYEDSQIVITGLSNANTIQCIDSSNKNVQTLYTKVIDNSQKSIIAYYFNTSGIYQKSQSILLPYATVGSSTDIKLNSNLNNITLTSTIQYKILLNTVYYNKDGTLAHTDTGITDTTVSYVVNYLFDSQYTDDNGNKYSIIKLNNPPNYTFTGGFMTNYNMYILGNQDDTTLNKNFSIRNNFESPTGDFKIILNNTINVSKLDKNLFQVNNLTGSENFYNINISPSPLISIFEYNINQMPTVNNTITSIGLSSLKIAKDYYIIFPKYGSISYIPVENITVDNNGDYVFQLDNVNDLRISTGGSFYGPYLYLTQFNQNIFYNLQFYPSSLNTPVYYSIQLNSLVLPNRPLRQNPEKYIKTLTDMPYIYVAIYSVDDEDLADREIVNIVYDNNPNREKIEIFQLNTVNAGDTSNFVTYTSSTVPKVKFNSTFTTLRIKIFDPYGNILLFDNTPYKSIDSRFTGSVVPPELMNISIQFTLIKKF